MNAFQITRADGRSNAQVILDHVEGDAPGTLYPFAQLQKILSQGTARTYTIDAVRSIVMAAYPRLLKEQQRALHNVRGKGYRLALAGDHNRLALDRKRRADMQLKRGLLTLQHVKWDELDDNQQKAHEGTLMIVGALWEAQAAMERRQSKVEAAIERLKGSK